MLLKSESRWDLKEAQEAGRWNNYRQDLAICVLVSVMTVVLTWKGMEIDPGVKGANVADVGTQENQTLQGGCFSSVPRLGEL